MTKVWGVHTITLRMGVKAADFEKFLTTEVANLTLYEGWKFHLLKGERGERKGQFMVLFEIDSLAARNRYAPSGDKVSPETEKFNKAHPEVARVSEKWATMATLVGDSTIFTDYVEIG